MIVFCVVDQAFIHYKETIVHGFEKLPKAFTGLFTGKTQGKIIVEIWP